jgi:alkylation response protein AidB-like acyl-CoA dehydrogenase
MELEFTEEQDELRASVRAMLTRECPTSVARAAAEDDATPDRVWAHMVGLGWPALTVPAEHDGIGLGVLEAAILAEELGRALAPGPLLPTVTQLVSVVREAGSDAQRARFLGPVAREGRTGTVAVAESTGGFDPADVDATVEVTGATARLAGTKRWVMEGDVVDEVVVVAREPGTSGDDGVRAVVVPRAAVHARRARSFDATRRYVHLDLSGVEVGAERVLEGGAAAIRRALEESTVAIALEMVGTAQRIFDVTLEYARQREQFGVPIGSFQAVKHKLADMLVALERARATGYFAALTIAEDDERRASATAVAKVAAGDCQRLIAKEGIQLHGGVGYTWEHDMHLYVKRVKAGEVVFGTSADHRERIARLLAV